MKRFFRIFVIAIAATTMFSGCHKENPGPKDTSDYLYFEAVEAGATVSMKMVGKMEAPTLVFSTNKLDWTKFDFSNPQTITLENVGDKVYWRNADKTDHFSENYENYVRFVSGEKKLAAGGNIMSLIDGSCQSLTIPSNYCFCALFALNSSLVSAPCLPATELSPACYFNMFSGCSSLEEAPVLPAMQLTHTCYYAMFNGCTSLKKAPELPATKLDYACYFSMFFECSSLEEAPELPATELAEFCYQQMFHSCSSLRKAPGILPAEELKNACYSVMFNSCTSLENAPEMKATTLATECCYCMFSNCPALKEAPALPATKLAENCYMGMFQGCVLFKQAPELPATLLADGCYSNMFCWCTAMETIPVLPASQLAPRCYEFMFENCSSLKNIKVVFEDWGDGTATAGWVSEVAAKGIFECPESLEVKYGYDYIPEGWNVNGAITPQGPSPLEISAASTAKSSAEISPKQIVPDKLKLRKHSAPELIGM